MPYKDPEKERACGRRRYERITAERIARGMCPRCGEARPAPDHSLCQCCGEKRRQAERARCTKARAAGILYAGRDAERCRWSASDRSKRRDRARQDARTCTRCGTHPPVEGGTVCEPCHVARRDREREQYAMRRDYASYYTSVVLIVAGLGYRRSPREPSHPRLFCRRRVGDFKQAVAGVAIDVSAQEPGLAPSVDRGARHPESLCDLVAPQQPAIAQPLIARL